MLLGDAALCHLHGDAERVWAFADPRIPDLYMGLSEN